MKKTDTETLVKALRILAVEIQSGDGIAKAAIKEAAQRIDELAAISLLLLKETSCEQSLPSGCARCALSVRLSDIGIRS